MSKHSSFDTVKRITSALIGLPVYAWCIITDNFYNIPVLLVSLVVSLAALHEFYVMTRKEHGEPFYFVGMVYGVILNLAFYVLAFGKQYAFPDWLQPRAFPFFLGALSFLAALILVLQLMLRPIKGGTYSIAVTLAGLFVIVIPFAHLILIKDMANGVYLIFLLNFTVMVNDSGAYFGGLLFGKHKTKFEVSPNKSWEGYVSGLLFSVLGVIALDYVYQRFFDVNLFAPSEAIVVGVMLSLLGTFGDLTESLIKRDSGVKDSGTMIPGHGGMWDTFDAIIFSLPLFYYYLLLKGIS